MLLISVSLAVIGFFFIAQAVKTARQRKETETNFNFFFLTGKKEYWFYLISGAAWMAFAFIIMFIESPQRVTKMELNITKGSAFILLISVIFLVAYWGIKRGTRIWKKVSREVDKAMK